MRDMRGILLFVMMAMALGACASQPAATKKAVSSDTAVMAKSDKRSARPAAIDTTPAPSFARDAGFDQPFALQQIAYSGSHLPDLGGPLLAQASDQAPPATAEPEAQLSDAEVSRQLNNPVSNLWQISMQNDMIIRDIEGFGDNQVLNNFKFQPVMPIPLTDEWRVVVRPVFQLNAYDIPQVPSGRAPRGGPAGLPQPPPRLPPGLPGGSFDTDFGLGDTIFLTAFSNSAPKSKWQYGFGPTWILPTATDDTLGARKWAVGPGGALVYLGGPGDVIAVRLSAKNSALGGERAPIRIPTDARGQFLS